MTPHLLLGNGFGIAYDRARFSYSALQSEAEARELIGPVASRLFESLQTRDFKIVIKSLQESVTALSALDDQKFSTEIAQISAEVGRLKEALAQVLAGLHPDLPYKISDEAYVQVRSFLDSFQRAYTANYDLLLYWALMQELEQLGVPERHSDDGFRDPGHESDYVLWDYLKPYRQSIYYLNGALHLYRSNDGLKKLTWRRTDEPLIDQIRAQLQQDSFPLYVAEGSSVDKLQRIHSSDYLARAFRSLAEIGGGLLAYDLSFDGGDKHIIDAVARSNVSRLAISLHGDPDSSGNRETIEAVSYLRDRRSESRPNAPLETTLFDASSVRLWR